MDNLWLWLFGLVALISLAVFIFPMFPLFRQPAASAPKKPELPRQKPMEEVAEEITLTPPRQREQEDIFIPHHYGVSRLVAVVKDPHWLYAYWEVSPETQRDFIKRYGQEAWHNSRQVLRVYDVTGLGDSIGQAGHSFQEIYLDPFAENWFIQVGQPERSFFLELGRLLADGTYVSLLSSNIVCTPRASVSPRFDEQWMWIAGLYQGNLRYGASSWMLAVTEDKYKQ